MPNPKQVGYSETYQCPRCQDSIRYAYGIPDVVDAHPPQEHCVKGARLPYATYKKHLCTKEKSLTQQIS